MPKSQPLPYLPAMFATCMLFQALFVLCVVLWAVFPGLNGHVLLTEVFPGFKLLDVASFFYGLIASMLFGWFMAVLFVFFYNLWPSLARFFTGGRTVTP